jgi:hypothetical protein
VKHAERLAVIEHMLTVHSECSNPAHAQALREVHQILTRLSTEKTFEVTTIVSRTDGKGKLDIVWCGQLVQLTPEAARSTAWVLIEAASVAEAEASLTRFLKDKVGVTPEAAAGILAEFRVYREADPQNLVAPQKGTPS